MTIFTNGHSNTLLSIHENLDQKRKRKVRQLQQQIAKLDLKLNGLKTVYTFI